MPLHCPLPYVFLIDFNAKPRTVRNVYVAVLEVHDFGVDKVICQVVALIVSDALTLLLNKRVVRGCIDLQAGSECDRTKRAMGREGHIPGFRHGSDLLALGDATGMGKIGLNNVGGTKGQQSLEVIAGK